ncbi:hypothetical protein LTS18_004098, partial [Coniosporium uncinatum]
FAWVEYAPGERKGSGGLHTGRQGTRWDGEGRKDWAEEDVAPGGDCLKLLLLPKPFTPDFRENWETYRREYWERENERRAELRRRVRARRRAVAKQEGGWLWWTGWRGWERAAEKMRREGPDVMHTPPHVHSRETMREKRRRPSIINAQRMEREGSHSRSSSRSSAPAIDEELGRTGSDRRRRKAASGGASIGRPSPLVSNGSGSSSRPSTPRVQGDDVVDRLGLNKKLSSLSSSSASSSGSGGSSPLAQEGLGIQVETPEEI